MRAATLTLLVLLGLGVLGLWLFVPAKTAPPPEPPVSKTDALVVPGEQLIETRSVGSQAREREHADPARIAAAYSFDGKGRIRGHIGERDGVVFPREWDLVIEPHPYLQGRERAESRRIRFRAGERDFVAEELPLGGYLVRAEAAALNSSGADVLLVKGSSDQFVELAFSPSGWLDGSVIDAKGLPVADVEVRLVAVPGKQTLSTRTDPAGAYQFRTLLDGDYEISFLIGGTALDKPRLVTFRAPRLSFPAEQLPPAGSLEVHVVDLLGKPAANVRVTGYCKPKGSLDLRTDDEGVARLPCALPGFWQIKAFEEGENLRASADVDVLVDETARVSLRLAR
ncbi:MAG: carboxypeptidase regulatory-like domain-containing protein [Planctomycetes bacterium]|nr:carboxypeptidase regulatory-like domain-containing protein [Planctomycetota bacterium]